MQLSKLIEELFLVYKEEGEQEVYIDLLTCEQSNRAEITGIDFFPKRGVSIDSEIENIKEFKKLLK